MFSLDEIRDPIKIISYIHAPWWAAAAGAASTGFELPSEIGLMNFTFEGQRFISAIIMMEQRRYVILYSNLLCTLDWHIGDELSFETTGKIVNFFKV